MNTVELDALIWNQLADSSRIPAYTFFRVIGGWKEIDSNNHIIFHLMLRSIKTHTIYIKLYRIIYPTAIRTGPAIQFESYYKILNKFKDNIV